MLSKEQRILIQLIAKSNDVWDPRSIDEISKWIGAERAIISYKPKFEDILGSYPIYCLGCHTVHTDQKNSYPSILTRCEKCDMKPLKFKSLHLWKGEARLWYIESAIYFPSPHARDFIINQVMTHGI